MLTQHPQQQHQTPQAHNIIPCPQDQTSPRQGQTLHPHCSACRHSLIPSPSLLHKLSCEMQQVQPRMHRTHRPMGQQGTVALLTNKDRGRHEVHVGYDDACRFMHAALECSTHWLQPRQQHDTASTSRPARTSRLDQAAYSSPAMAGHLFRIPCATPDRLV